MRRIATLLVCVLLLAGCRSGKPRLVPLPARVFATAGGERLELSGRTISVRPAPEDIESALGAGLAVSAAGVAVTNRLHARTALQPGDRIVHVAARLPGDGGKQKQEPPPLDPAGLRRRPGAHPVRRIDDLRGYLAGAGWVELELLVLRAGREAVVRQKLLVKRRAVKYEEVQPEEADRLGYTACALADWPEQQRPAHAAAHPQAQMVVRVEADSPAALAGLRPGDLLLEQKGDPALDAVSLRIYKPDGTERRLALQAHDRRGFWIPLLASYSDDGVRRHLGLGPFDWLFHWSARETYDAAADRHQHTERWSVLTLVQWQSSWSRGIRKRYIGVDPIVDVPRLEYFVEWIGD